MPSIFQTPRNRMSQAGWNRCLFSVAAFLCGIFVGGNLFAATLGEATLAVGPPVPALCPGVVSKIPVVVSTGEGVNLAGFDLLFAISHSGGAQVITVNGTTAPAGVDPVLYGADYDESHIYAYLPSVGTQSNPGENQSGPGADFAGNAGADGILELINESLSPGSARVAYAYQSKTDTGAFGSGTLFDIFVYTGLLVSPDATIDIAFLPSDNPQLAGFDAGVIATTSSDANLDVYPVCDVDRSGTVDLADAIKILRVLNREAIEGLSLVDVNHDETTGLAEAVFAMQVVAELR